MQSYNSEEGFAGEKDATGQQCLRFLYAQLDCPSLSFSALCVLEPVIASFLGSKWLGYVSKNDCITCVKCDNDGER